MRRNIVCVLIMLALICLFAMQAQATLLEDMQARYAELTRQKAEIETKMILLEGAFIERQAIITEQAAEKAEVVEPVETIEEQIEASEKAEITE